MSERKAKAKKVFITDTENGEAESRSATENWKRLEFRFENGNTLAVSRDQFPDNVVAAAMGHGLSQKIGDAYSGATTIDEAQEKAEALVEQLQQGIWVTERESSGPRIGPLVEAIARVLEANGRPANREHLKGLYHGDKEKQKAAKANPEVAAMYDKIKAEEAAARAKESAKAAKGAESDLDSLVA